MTASVLVRHLVRPLRHFDLVQKLVTTLVFFAFTMAEAFPLLARQCPQVQIITDSFLKPDKIISRRVRRTGNSINIVIAPHHCVSEFQGQEYEEAQYWLKIEYRGGWTFQGVLRNPQVIESWAAHIPRVTVIHLGGCDIANTELGESPQIRVDYPELVKKFFQSFLRIAKRSRGLREHVSNPEFDEHKFVLVTPPDWGDFNQIREGLDAAQYGMQRKRAVSGLKRKANQLWQDYGAALILPKIEDPDRYGTIHIVDNATQREYADQVLNAVSRLLCRYCTPSRYVKWADFSSQLLLPHCQHQPQ